MDIYLWRDSERWERSMGAFLVFVNLLKTTYVYMGPT